MANNWEMFFVAGLIPMLVGFVWYGKWAFGSQWLKVNHLTSEEAQKRHKPLVYIVSYIFSVFIALALSGMVIHQTNVFQVMMPDVMVAGSEAEQEFNNLMLKYGSNFRDFKHGAIHGLIITIFFILPLFGINSLFEGRGWKYIFIHVGYWLVCLVLMGGILCSTLQYG